MKILLVIGGVLALAWVLVVATGAFLNYLGSNRR